MLVTAWNGCFKLAFQCFRLIIYIEKVNRIKVRLTDNVVLYSRLLELPITCARNFLRIFLTVLNQTFGPSVCDCFTLFRFNCIYIKQCYFENGAKLCWSSVYTFICNIFGKIQTYVCHLLLVKFHFIRLSSFPMLRILVCCHSNSGVIVGLFYHLS